MAKAKGSKKAAKKAVRKRVRLTPKQRKQRDAKRAKERAARKAARAAKKAARLATIEQRRANRAKIREEKRVAREAKRAEREARRAERKRIREEKKATREQARVARKAERAAKKAAKAAEPKINIRQIKRDFKNLLSNESVRKVLDQWEIDLKDLGLPSVINFGKRARKEKSEKKSAEKTVLTMKPCSKTNPQALALMMAMCQKARTETVVNPGWMIAFQKETDRTQRAADRDAEAIAKFMKKNHITRYNDHGRAVAQL